MSRSRIQWNSRERAIIINYAVKLLREQPSCPVFRAVGEAQSLHLPLDRQRKTLTRATLGDLYGDIIRELNRPVPKAVVPTPEAAESSAQDAVALAVNNLSARFERELREALSGVAERVMRDVVSGEKP